MTTYETALDAEELQRAARDHLWLHFTRMGGHEPPIIVRGDGCYLEDIERQALPRRARRPLRRPDRLRLRRGDRARPRSSRCASCRSTPTGRTRIPRAIELAAEVASLAPGDLNRVFFVSGGSEAVESAWKLARQYHAARGGSAAGRRSRATSRTTARRWARSRSTASRRCATPFEPLVPEVRHVRNTNRYHRPSDETEEEFTAFLLDELEQTIVQVGPETVAMVIMEPVQNAGGAFIAAGGLLAGRPRDLRPVRDPALRRRGDHRLRSARRLVRLRALRHPARHHHLREGALVGVRGDRRGRSRPTA